MAKKPDQKPDADPALPKVIADFGGRRKILDRRRQQVPTNGMERRSGKDRRSGFDRRGALTQSGDKDTEKRKDFDTDDTDTTPTSHHASTR